MDELSQGLSLPTRPQEGEGEEEGGEMRRRGRRRGEEEEGASSAASSEPCRRGPAAAPLERKALERKRLSQKTATDGNSAKRCSASAGWGEEQRKRWGREEQRKRWMGEEQRKGAG